MKQYFFVLPVVLFMLLQFSVSAQRDKSHTERWEKFQAEKVAFLTSNLDLSPAEAQKFWPVYNKMDKERSEEQQTRRDLEKKVLEAGESLSEKEIIKLTRDYAVNKEKEGALLTKYNEEFLKILSPQKVLKLYKSENEFRMHMFEKYRNSKK